MAEGYIRDFAKNNTEVYSAGIEAHGVNPKAIQTMAEDGIDISKHSSNNVDEYKQIHFDYVVTVCDNAKERCPYFPSAAIKLHQNFPDPTKYIGSEAEINEAFRMTRSLIKSFSKKFVDDYIN
jgi:arsenate reductase